MKQSNTNKRTNEAVGQGLTSEVCRTTRYETEMEQRTGSPLCREVEGIRTGRRTTTRPPDPRTTRDGNNDAMRVRWSDDHDAAVGSTTGGQRWQTTQRVGNELQRAPSGIEVRPPTISQLVKAKTTGRCGSSLADDKFNMATSTPEVLTTRAGSKTGTRFRRLLLCFRGRREEWSIDRN